MSTEHRTPTGTPIVHCGDCRRPHSVNLRHCDRCGRASTFISPAGVCIHCEPGRKASA